MIQRRFLVFIFLCFSDLYSCQTGVNFVKNVSTFYYIENLPTPSTKSANLADIEVAYCLTQGRRIFQQDTLLINDKVISETGRINKILINIQKYCFSKSLVFGVFDGHGLSNNDGFKVSDYAAQQMKEQFAKDQTQDIVALLQNLNQDLFKQEHAHSAGSTACIFTVNSDGDMTVYNIGGSRALWGTGKDEHTKDHGVKNQCEVERVKKLGVTVDRQRFDNTINVSRALGDYKLSLHNKDVQKGFISDQAETYKLDNKKHQLFIGCDGCFADTENEEIWTIYITLLSEKKPLDQIAWYILYYIIKSNAEKNKCIYKNAAKNPHEKMTVEKYNDLMNGIDHQKFNFYDILKLKFADVKQYCTKHCDILDDNTSFILFNRGELERRFWLLNKERAILLLLLLMSVCGKYFYTNNYF